METTRERASRPGFTLPRERVFWAVSLGHFTNDVFMGMTAVLVTFLSTDIMPMSAAQIGLAISGRELMGSLTQPLFGWLADRYGGRWLGAGGVAWQVVLLMLALWLSLSGQFWVMLIPLSLSGVGSGMFHPVGTMHATESEPEREASNTAYFFLFGQTGLALSPALVGFLLDEASTPGGILSGAANPLTPIFALSLAAAPAILLMGLRLPDRRQHGDKVARVEGENQEKPGSSVARVALVPLLAMMGIVLIRSVTQSASSAYTPVLFQRKGWGPAQYGLIASVMWLSSAISGVVFGRLADHYDRRHIIAATLLLAAPPLFLLPLADGAFAILLAFLTGGLLGGSFSIIVVLAQHIIPSGRAFASGAILGFTFVVGALGSLSIGMLADGMGALFEGTAASAGGIGLAASYQVLAGMSLISGLLTLALPRWLSGRPVEARNDSP